MHTSGAGTRFIQSFEKCNLAPYDDEGGKSSIGWGHLILPGEDFSQGITQDEADDIFLLDLTTKGENPVKCSVAVDLNQPQFDALVSLCYNIGAGNFAKSTLLKLLNAGNLDSASDQFPLWDHCGGVVSKGLYARRIAEKNIFDNGVYNNHL